jgi:hypothetical protein
MRTMYLKAAVAAQHAYDELAVRYRRRMQERDSQAGVTSLEIAVYAAVLLGIAIALALLIKNAVANHDSTIK